MKERQSEGKVRNEGKQPQIMTNNQLANKRA